MVNPREDPSWHLAIEQNDKFPDQRRHHQCWRRYLAEVFLLLSFVTFDSHYGVGPYRGGLTLNCALKVSMLSAA